MEDVFHHEYWFETSRKLKISADLLITEVRSILKLGREDFVEKNFEIRSFLETNLLLLGYSIENAAKGNLIRTYLVQNQIPPDCDVTWLSKNIWKAPYHDLSVLVGRTALELSDDDREFLKRLSKYIIWKGRYHIPKKASDILKEVFVGEGDRFTSRDQTLAEDLLKKLIE
jgi:hypothetical protein